MKIIIAAGGTGGHLIPAQQLADELLSHGESVHFMGAKLSSNRNFKSEKYPFYDIKSSPLNKNFFKSACLIFSGLMSSLHLLIKMKADLIVGFGSYHSFPILLAALFLRKPIFLFESNTSLGKVNRFFAKRAKVLAVQFPMVMKKNMRLVKMLPWIENNEEFYEVRGSLGLNSNLFTFLVFGGSQGADFINSLFLKTIQKFKDRKDFQVIHLTGNEKQELEIKKRYLEMKIHSYVKSYEKRMKLLYLAADIAICRSGASSLSELIYYEVPSILIPYPHSSDDHQIKNGSFMEKIGGAYMFLQQNIDEDLFFQKILNILDRKDKNFLEMKKKLSDYKKVIKKENRKSLLELILEFQR